jgi:hypothetical protein
MGWPYDGKPNRLIKVFFKSAEQQSDLSDFSGIRPVFPRAFLPGHWLNDGPPGRFRVDDRKERAGM